MRNFKKLIVWQKSMEIVSHCYDLSEQFPSNEKFGLSSQIKRASVSIASNIAEGSSRSSDKDYNRFLEIALGSVFELETQILIAEEKLKSLDTQEVNLIKEKIIEVQRMLSGLMNSLKN